ncbi:MAG: aminoacyl-histidine dipeptidase [Spirochaetia bacterium]|nr:aminoacyl-histidine dipeptidase [Spirochaetia bacterium]
MTDLKNLEPSALFNYFKDISDIPRESGNEEGVRKYLLDFAKKNNFEAKVDKIGNVIIYVPATKGFENRSTVALQGHMDMVCVKTLESKHNFDKDPIQLEIEGDFLKAKDTTLGGDNGIAIAMALDVFTDTSVKHGPLEGIFTVSEETGLTGAFNIEAENIKSRKLINLDSEEEGIIYIGCAGGIETQAKLNSAKETLNKNDNVFKLTVKDLLGGHSGAEIHMQRANAIKLVARTLINLKTLKLVSINGGTKRNVIPSSCECIFAIDDCEVSTIKENVEALNRIYQDEYSIQEPLITVLFEETKADSAFLLEDSINFIRSIFLAPHGVSSMSMELKGVVETSSNLAIVKTNEEGFEAISSHRSSIMSSRDNVANKCAQAFLTSNAKVEQVGAYPSWKPDLSSKLTDFCAKAYKEYSKKEPVLTAIHAGLECGIINSRIPGMDSVSFGPDMFDVHSVKERLSISSTKRTSEFLKHLLSIIE